MRECLAAREGVSLAASLGYIYSRWILEMDDINVVRAIQSPIPQALEAIIIDDIRDVISLTTSGVVYYASRKENGAAHYLTTFVISQFVDFASPEPRGSDVDEVKQPSCGKGKTVILQRMRGRRKSGTESQGVTVAWFA
ncbi:hypothetical protein TIFTF001_019899 [Ficus carica]|uniref:Uncharacterized protein n=1 Tax=Ficus carica TaxID=3494 RepID=A0AA88AEE2_FICCA|nr:hypothetical protein TIFTF001_019899 [Ficus carica]